MIDVKILFLFLNGFIRIKAMQGNFKCDAYSDTNPFRSVPTEEEVALARTTLVNQNPRTS